MFLCKPRKNSQMEDNTIRKFHFHSLKFRVNKYALQSKKSNVIYEMITQTIHISKHLLTLAKTNETATYTTYDDDTLF